jgi:hypothetical protein
MSDEIQELSEREITDLCALADGTLPAERRAEVEARVAGSPALLELVERQRRSLAATRALADEPVPSSLTTAIAARRRPQRAWPRRRRLGLAMTAAGALVAVVVAVLVIDLAGGPAGPTVADAAVLAIKPPTGPAPASTGAGKQLAADVQGLAFPDLAGSFGWRATGVRYGTVGAVGGRAATVVYYEKGGRQIAYVIVARPTLPQPSQGQIVMRGGVDYSTLSVDGRPAVTWQRLGHTCVLIGGASPDELLTLASWQQGGTHGY